MKTFKFKGKLSIDKQTIAQLTDAQLESIQGGAGSSSSSSTPASNGCTASCNSCITCPIKKIG
ncbi:class I lanthipeptide [Pontibacter sp. G13]|uniref:class I lanthipeptide n=1 Tax=Pontibacter sp. G13 TaxID=3074898 RepID=UPI00288A8BAF|nr:class I lanthipeptide [Pontibacter sp. G13]WNJ17536.1 class I lanthipeptide [Pontibacter sp. G13]